MLLASGFVIVALMTIMLRPPTAAHYLPTMCMPTKQASINFKWDNFRRSQFKELNILYTYRIYAKLTSSRIQTYGVAASFK